MSCSHLVGAEPTPNYKPELAALLGYGGGEANGDISLLEMFWGKSGYPHIRINKIC